MKIIKLLCSLSFLLTAFLLPAKVQAVCPVCTVAVGAGLGFSRLLGIDDSVSGLWIGALIISSGLWTASWFGKRKFGRGLSPKWAQVIFITLFYLLILLPLNWMGIFSLPNNTLVGLDKIIFGVIAGSLVFFLGVLADKILRQLNQGKVYIYYQKVILPVLFLSLTSFVLYLVV